MFFYYVFFFHFKALAVFSELSFWVVLLIVSIFPKWCSSSVLVHIGKLDANLLALLWSFCILLRSVFVNFAQVVCAYKYSCLTIVLYRYIIKLEFLFFAVRCLSMFIICCIFVTILLTWFVQVNLGQVQKILPLCLR